MLGGSSLEAYAARRAAMIREEFAARTAPPAPTAITLKPPPADRPPPLERDGPPCHVCGGIMVRCGSCHRCPDCGETSGCG